MIPLLFSYYCLFAYVILTSHYRLCIYPVITLAKVGLYDVISASRVTVKLLLPRCMRLRVLSISWSSKWIVSSGKDVKNIRVQAELKKKLLWLVSITRLIFMTLNVKVVLDKWHMMGQYDLILEIIITQVIFLIKESEWMMKTSSSCHTYRYE